MYGPCIPDHICDNSESLSKQDLHEDFILSHKVKSIKIIDNEISNIQTTAPLKFLF